MKRSILCALAGLISTFLFLGITNNVFAQRKTTKPNSSKQNPDVIATIGNETITFSDLEKVYSKNLSKKNTPLNLLSKDSLLDFLNLYIRYRLKVQDAISRGLDKEPSIQEEINQNRRLLAETFFFEKKLVEPNVEKMLKYRNSEALVSYIFIQFPVSEFDTTSAYNKATHLLSMIREGKDFAQLAKDSSDDRESAERGGLILNYITGGKVQRPIEDAIFSLAPSSVYPHPIKTKFGYFIVKLNKIQPRIKVKARHILLPISSDKDSSLVYKKADSLLLLLKNGMDFARLAEENSEDPSSSMRGGELGGWYSRSGGLEPAGKFLTHSFEEALFSLKDGEISNKIRTEYGLHIIKRDSTSTFSIEDDREDLKRLYKRIYFESDKQEYIDKLRKEYGFHIDYNILTQFLANLDTSKTTLDTAWTSKISTNLMSQNLFGILDKKYTVQDFINTLKTKPEFRATPLNHNGLTNVMNRIVYPIVIDKATQNLEAESPEFASMMKEFRDGILLFKVEALEVWDKLKFDTTLAYNYWQANKSKYKTYPTYDVTEVFVLTDSMAQAIYKRATEGNEKFEELAKQFTQRSNFREKEGKWGKISTKDNKLAKKLQELNANVGQIVGPFAFENGYSIVKVNSFEPSREKTFQEAIPDFATEVQEIQQKQLTEKWVKKLQQKFPVKIFTQNIDKIRKGLK